VSALDPRVLALIHADIDGELDGADRAGLESRLAVLPEARVLRDDLRRMSRALERIPQQDPPSELRAGVVAAVHAGAQWATARGRTRRRPALQLGFALAAGIALAAIGMTWLRTDGPGIDATDVVGTMGQRMAPHAIEVALPQIQGTVALRAGADGWIVELALASDQAVEVGLRYDGGSLRLVEPAPGITGDPAQGRLGFVNRGKGLVTAYLQPERGAKGAIRVEFHASGRLLHEATIQVPVAAR
jgi:hypothetical protein